METNQNEEHKGLTWLPLGTGFTQEDKQELEREFGSNWRDLFNGL